MDTSISSANSIKHHQLFAIFCTCACTTEWWFPSSGRSFLSVLARTGANGCLKSLYGQEASVQQKQNFKCCRLWDKIFGTFLWCFAPDIQHHYFILVIIWLVSCYIMWFLPWKSCPFCRRGHIVSLAEFPQAVDPGTPSYRSAGLTAVCILYSWPWGWEMYLLSACLQSLTIGF